MAISHTLDDLNSLTQLAAEKYSDDIAAIFSGHHTLLDDAELIDSACELLRTHGYSAEWAWHTVMADLSAQYRQLDDAYLQARYIDVDDILQRVLGHLTQTTERHPQHQRPTIIIADDIYPSVVLQLDTRKVAGISLKEGSALSHSAIIAREAGIPFLCQQGDALQNFCSGDLLTLENVPVRS
jgi:PTS hybrid protein